MQKLYVVILNETIADIIKNNLEPHLKIKIIVANNLAEIINNLEARDILIASEEIIIQNLNFFTNPNVQVQNIAILNFSEDTIDNLKGDIFYKPIVLWDILNRINYYLDNKQSNTITVGDFILEKHYNEAFIKNFKDNSVINITKKEANILHEIFVYYPNTCSLEELLRFVNNLEETPTNLQTINSHISNIRKKLQIFENKINLIKNEQGYKISIT